MNQKDLKKMLQWLSFVLKCPVCNWQYEVPNIKVVESDQDDGMMDTHLLIHADCDKCKSSVMFNIDINGPEIFTVIAKTDLSKNDTDKFKYAEAIQIDELIALHKGLKKFDGDFIKAFKKTSKQASILKNLNK